MSFAPEPATEEVGPETINTNTDHDTLCLCTEFSASEEGTCMGVMSDGQECHRVLPASKVMISPEQVDFASLRKSITGDQKLSPKTKLVYQSINSFHAQK